MLMPSSLSLQKSGLGPEKSSYCVPTPCTWCFFPRDTLNCLMALEVPLFSFSICLYHIVGNTGPAQDGNFFHCGYISYSSLGQNCESQRQLTAPQQCLVLTRKKCLCRQTRAHHTPEADKSATDVMFWFSTEVSRPGGREYLCLRTVPVCESHENQQHIHDWWLLIASGKEDLCCLPGAARAPWEAPKVPTRAWWEGGALCSPILKISLTQRSS